jgi:predicted GH43/DUF377 family glycosyl hydrolase
MVSRPNVPLRRRLPAVVLTITIVALGAAFAAGRQTPAQPAFGAWTRMYGEQPILSPRGAGFEARGVFNPAVIAVGKKFVMLYRAQDASGVSRLGYAESTDGVTFARDEAPVLSPESADERGGGVEDPRLVRSGETFYLTYTAYNGHDAQLALATSRDLRRWDRKGVILPANQGRWNVHWTKSGAIWPERINGKYWMFYMGDAQDRSDQTGIASSNDLLTWTDATDQPILPRRAGKFDSRVVEPGPPPVMTAAGLLLLYNGADDALVYRTGWALFDRADPTHLLARSDEPLFAPETPWEKSGQVPNVVFAEGLIVQPDRWLIYYGAADTRVGVAAISPPPR